MSASAFESGARAPAGGDVGDAGGRAGPGEGASDAGRTRDATPRPRGALPPAGSPAPFAPWRRLSRFQRRSTHRVAELLVEAVGELVDARGDLVEVHGLLAPVALHYVHGHCETLGKVAPAERGRRRTRMASRHLLGLFENKTRLVEERSM